MHTLADGSKSTDYKIGDKFELVENCNVGNFLEFSYDDKTDSPYFLDKRGCEICYYWSDLKPLNTLPWYEKGELLPVGTKCEVSVLGQDFRWFETRGFYKGNFWMASAATGYIAELVKNCTFLPIQSERDRLARELYSTINYNGKEPEDLRRLEDYAKAIDAGWRPKD